MTHVNEGKPIHLEPVSSFNLFKKNICKGSNMLKTYYLIISLIAACLIVYWPVFTHEFQLHWDDQWVVMNDYTEGGFSKANISDIFTEFFHGQYAPINELFYLILYNLFGYNAFWFHTASLIIHISNVLLVFFLLQKLLRHSSQFEELSISRIAFIASLLMAVHPFLVEPVSWMSASKCILFALFYLLALNLYLNYLISKNLWYYGLTLLLFIISFGAKEQAVTLPVCLLLFDYLLKRNMQSSKVWFEKLPLFCLSICFVFITFYSQASNNEGILSSQQQYPLYQRLVFASYTITEYIIKCFLPLRLSYIYPFPNMPGEPMPFYMWLYPVVLLFATIGYWKFWRRPWIVFGIGFFLIQISIVSNVIPTSRYSIVADRYVYLPSLGIFFLIAYFLNIGLQRKNRYRHLIFCCCLVYLVSMSAYANRHCKVWHNSETLKKEMIHMLKSRTDYKDWLKQNKVTDSLFY